MTGAQLHTQLMTEGASLHLDAEGRLSVRPASVAARYRAAIPQHLCYLLTAAAIDEVRRLLATAQITLTQVRPMVSTELLNAACLGGEVATCRQAAVAYVQAWHTWLTGEGA